VPFPTATPQETVDALAARILDVLDFVQAENVTERDHLQVGLSAQAQSIYAQLYRGELIDDSAGERVTALLERRAPMLLRLAMIFALCDLTTVRLKVKQNQLVSDRWVCGLGAIGLQGG
jgi:hypothetical protein